MQLICRLKWSYRPVWLDTNSSWTSECSNSLQSLREVSRQLWKLSLCIIIIQYLRGASRLQNMWWIESTGYLLCVLKLSQALQWSCAGVIVLVCCIDSLVVRYKQSWSTVEIQLPLNAVSNRRTLLMPFQLQWLELCTHSRFPFTLVLWSISAVCGQLDSAAFSLCGWSWFRSLLISMGIDREKY